MIRDILAYLTRSSHERRDKLFPIQDPTIKFLKNRAMNPPNGCLPLGVIRSPSQEEIPFLLSREEIFGHAMVLGKTGSGKTCWALTYADQLAKANHSIACISPHPDLDRGFLAIAAKYGRPCIHIDFSGRGQTITPFSFFNIHGVRPDELAHLAQTLFASSFGGGGAAGAIRSTLGPLFNLLASAPNELSLLDVDRLIMEPDVAGKYLSRLRNPLPHITRFFSGLAGKQRAALIQQSRWALARVHALLSFRGVRLTLCGRKPIDLREAIKRPLVLVVSVPSASLGDMAGLLAGMVVEHIRLILMQRPVPCTEPALFLFIDELGGLVKGTPQLGAFLAEARKFKSFILGLTQSTSQLEQNKQLMHSFDTNLSLLVLGRLGEHDAKRYSRLPFFDQSAERFQVEGPWLEGNDTLLQDPRASKTRLRDSGVLESKFLDCPQRHFYIHTSLTGSPTTIRVKALNYKAPQTQDFEGLNKLGSRSATEVERELLPAIPKVQAPQKPSCPKVPNQKVVITKVSRGPRSQF